MQIYQSPWLRWIPVAGSALVLMALLISVIIATASDNYFTGGLDLPYISDTFREGGSYILACIIVPIGSIMLLVCHIAMNQRLFVLECSAGSKGLSAARYFATGCGCIGVIFLDILVIVNTKMEPDIHLYAAYAFFVLSIFNITTVTILFHFARRRAIANGSTDASLNSSRTSKFSMWSIILINFIIYIPVGVSILCDWQQLPDGNFDYTNCLGTHKMRAATQHLCVWSMLGFYATYYLDFRPDLLKVAAAASAKPEVRMDNLEQIQVVETRSADYSAPIMNSS